MLNTCKHSTVGMVLIIDCTYTESQKLLTQADEYHI